jgi:hypothetical protein
LVVPIPGSTSGISRLGVVERGENTGSFFEIVSLEAGKASPIISVSFTLIGYWNTFFISIENPIFRA